MTTGAQVVKIRPRQIIRFAIDSQVGTLWSTFEVQAVRCGMDLGANQIEVLRVDINREAIVSEVPEPFIIAALRSGEARLIDIEEKVQTVFGCVTKGNAFTTDQFHRIANNYGEEYNDFFPVLLCVQLLTNHPRIIRLNSDNFWLLLPMDCRRAETR